MNKAFNLTVLFLLAGAIILKAPSFLDNSSNEGRQIEFYKIEKFVNAKEKLPIVFPPRGKKSVVFFWATWCLPCKIELSRINSAIEKNVIDPKSIYAVSIDENLELVDKTILEKKYLFTTYLNSDQSLLKKLKITATPTLVLIDENGVVKLQTTGVSVNPVGKISAFLQN